MCGRFTFTTDLHELALQFPSLTVPDAAVPPRYNIAPTQPVAVLPNREDRRLDFFVWGLIPSWAKDPKIGSKLINARSETAAEKPSFRSAYKRRRCLIFTDGFYEWKKEPGQAGKTPMFIHLADEKPFAFAGLWEYWQSPHGDEILSCTILTTEPNDFMREIHNRMPVILPPQSQELWLSPGELDREVLDPLMRPYPAEDMRAYAVSTLVNSPANDLPQCIEPA